MVIYYSIIYIANYCAQILKIVLNFSADYTYNVFASDKMVCKESFIVCVCMCVPLVQCPQRLKESSIP